MCGPKFAPEITHRRILFPCQVLNNSCDPWQQLYFPPCTSLPRSHFLIRFCHMYFISTPIHQHHCYRPLDVQSFHPFNKSSWLSSISPKKNLNSPFTQITASNLRYLMSAHGWYSVNSKVNLHPFLCYIVASSLGRFLLKRSLSSCSL